MAETDPLIQAITPKTPWYIVLRPFNAERRFARGEVVDTITWSSTASLVENRYLAPLPIGFDLPEADSEGRRFIELDAEQEKAVPEKKRPTPVRKAQSQA